jgi:ribosomal protein S18 acetylase RimI-like enzyme
VGIVYGALETGNPEMAHVYSMWVEPAARRSGVGRRLVDAVASWAKSQGARVLVLGVTQDNDPAQRLYERAGFSLTGRVEPLRPGSSLRVVVMQRFLSRD